MTTGSVGSSPDASALPQPDQQVDPSTPAATAGPRDDSDLDKVKRRVEWRRSPERARFHRYPWAFGLPLKVVRGGYTLQ